MKVTALGVQLTVRVSVDDQAAHESALEVHSEAAAAEDEGSEADVRLMQGRASVEHHAQSLSLFWGADGGQLTCSWIDKDPNS